MTNGKLTFTIDGWGEALPVRGVPYVGNWEKVSPLWVARYLAQIYPFTKGCAPLAAYHMPDDMPVPMQPREWGAAVASIEGYEAELKHQHASAAIGYAAWMQGAAEKLPAGVFVWLDEFGAVYRDHCERQHLGTDDLILAPMLDEATRAMVREGFGPRKLHAANNPQDETAKREHLIGWYDSLLDADVYLGLASVTPREAAMLLCEFNPGDDTCNPLTYTNLKTGPDDFKRLLRWFEDVNKSDPTARTLRQWRAVAADKGLKCHSWIDRYAQALHVPIGAAEVSTAQLEPRPETGAESQNADAQIAGAGAAVSKDAQGETAQQQTDSEPFLKPKNKNSRDAVRTWVHWQAWALVHKDDKARALVERIWLIADSFKYGSERSKDGESMTRATILKELPQMVTGGRGKNRGRSKTGWPDYGSGGKVTTPK